MIPAANFWNNLQFFALLIHFSSRGFTVCSYSRFRFNPKFSALITFSSSAQNFSTWIIQVHLIVHRQPKMHSLIFLFHLSLFNNPFRTCLNHVSKGRRKRKARKNHTHYTAETYRDESNGTTKSKNKLHLTIFHKRMTSWFRKNMSRCYENKSEAEKRRSNEWKRGRACCFRFPLVSWSYSSLVRTNSSPRVLMREMCVVKMKKQQSGLWCCFTPRILRLLLLLRFFFFFLAS
jgi:hypothetical protein